MLLGLNIKNKISLTSFSSMPMGIKWTLYPRSFGKFNPQNQSYVDVINMSYKSVLACIGLYDNHFLLLSDWDITLQAHWYNNHLAMGNSFFILLNYPFTMVWLGDNNWILNHTKWKLYIEATGADVKFKQVTFVRFNWHQSNLIVTKLFKLA